MIGQPQFFLQLAHRASLVFLAGIDMARRTGIPETGALVL